MVPATSEFSISSVPFPHLFPRYINRPPGPRPITSLCGAWPWAKAALLETSASQPHPNKRLPTRNCHTDSSLLVSLSDLWGARPQLVQQAIREIEAEQGPPGTATPSKPTSPAIPASDRDLRPRTGF